MNDKCILVSGRTIVSDEELCRELEKIAVVVKNQDNTRIENVLKAKKIDFILLEISNMYCEQLIIKKIKKQFPQILLIIINGNGDCRAIASGFYNGAMDAFRKPYHIHLLVERVKELLLTFSC